VRIASLFSGIGGLELGLEAAGVGHTVVQVEQDPYCRAVLRRHWPEANQLEDIRYVRGQDLQNPDLICGGFPCQDVSAAGRGAGLAGARSGLWYEFARLVGEARPSWVVVENVASGAKRWVDAVRGSLGQLGYETLPIPIAASDVGAPHLRRRVFIVAHANSRRREGERQPAQTGQQSKAGREPDGRGGSRPEAPQPHRAHEGWASGPPVCGVDDGASTRLDRDRLRALGNAVVPQCAMVVGCVLRRLANIDPMLDAG
jgi:DNA (cytosine-5)-methyltransferase 1